MKGWSPKSERRGWKKPSSKWAAAGAAVQKALNEAADRLAREQYALAQSRSWALAVAA